LKESTIIPDELNTYINIYNSITRSWFQNDDKEDVPFFIMLSNPEKKPYSALFDLFQCDFNWDDANVKNQYIINKKYRFIGIWTAPFKLPNKTYSLGRIENISNIYPFLRESNKKVIFWENVKDYFDEIIGLHIAKTTIILGLVLINNVKCLYGREIRYEDYVREKINHKQEQVTFFCDDWEDKEDFNEKDKSGFDILINYYSISKVYASTEWSLEKLNKKAVQLLKKDKELR
jgi:hypothetical protein